ncbi:hypothetical protein RMSM_02037 [Rhodopirellula maiorica SM1]|uniref:Uncharacterized protein n=1 Tax=Rhodopirellula maiorica SM1 TaxID=1265738 RepID=M5S055_9BACT|nr:hypothetical protein RMSM_02037 [Rhodopirellula maiorica SM1]
MGFAAKPICRLETGPNIDSVVATLVSAAEKKFCVDGDSIARRSIVRG